MDNDNQIFLLGWLDPRDDRVTHAGIAFYNSGYGEYFLRVDEDPLEKQYFLKPYEANNGTILYRLELVIKKKTGQFVKRQKVGEGYANQGTNGNIHISYGSKFKTLILYTKDNQ